MDKKNQIQQNSKICHKGGINFEERVLYFEESEFMNKMMGFVILGKKKQKKL